MSLSPWWRGPAAWGRRVGTTDPFDLLRAAVVVLLAAGTLLAAGFWLVTRDARFLRVILGFWAVYGLVMGAIGGVFDPLARWIGNAASWMGSTGSGRRDRDGPPEP